MTRRADGIAFLLGAAAAALSDAACRRLLPERRTTVLAVALPGAAAIYPLARSGWSEHRPATRELVALAAFGAVGGLGASRAERGGNRIAAAGWLVHAGFDARHDRGSGSRIPSWYPAMCAGYDVTLAGLLVR